MGARQVPLSALPIRARELPDKSFGTSATPGHLGEGAHDGDATGLHYALRPKISEKNGSTFGLETHVGRQCLVYPGGSLAFGPTFGTTGVYRPFHTAASDGLFGPTQGGGCPLKTSPSATQPRGIIHVRYKQ
jgi:hypothetical protein